MGHKTRTLQEQIDDLNKEIVELKKNSHPPRDLVADLVEAIKRGDREVTDAIRSASQPLRFG